MKTAKKTATVKKTVRVLVVPFGAKAYPQEISKGLQGLRTAIGGGFIEHLALRPGLGLYCDEDGLMKGYAPNRIVNGHNIVGAFIVVGERGSNERDLTDAEVEKLTSLFNVNL